MRFANGKQALEWFVENKNNVRGPLPSGMTLRIVDRDGHGLEYDSNSLPGMPGWAEIIHTIVDIERMLKKLTRSEIIILLRWAFFGFKGYETEEEAEDCREYSSMPKARYERLRRALMKFEGHLKRGNYLFEGIKKICPNK